MTKHAAKQEAAHPATTKVGVMLQGREYIVACDAGEERKLAEIVRLVDSKLDEISKRGAGAGASETRLFMLTCLLIADELIETRKAAAEHRKAEEDLMVAAVNHLRDRVTAIATQVGRA